MQNQWRNVEFSLKETTPTGSHYNLHFILMNKYAPLEVFTIFIFSASLVLKTIFFIKWFIMRKSILIIIYKTLHC